MHIRKITGYVASIEAKPLPLDEESEPRSGESRAIRPGNPGISNLKGQSNQSGMPKLWVYELIRLVS